MLESGRTSLFALSITLIFIQLLSSAIYTYFNSRRMYGNSWKTKLETILAFFNLLIGYHVKSALEKGHALYELTRLRLLEACLETAPQLLIQVFFWLTSEFYAINVWLLLSFILSISTLTSMVEYYDGFGIVGELDIFTVDYWVMKSMRVFELGFRIVLYAFIGNMLGGWTLFIYCLIICTVILGISVYNLLHIDEDGSQMEIMDMLFISMMAVFFLQPPGSVCPGLVFDLAIIGIKIVETLVFVPWIFAACKTCYSSWILGMLLGLHILCLALFFMKIDFNYQNYFGAKYCKLGELFRAQKYEIIENMIRKKMIKKLDAGQALCLNEFMVDVKGELQDQGMSKSEVDDFLSYDVWEYAKPWYSAIKDSNIVLQGHTAVVNCVAIFPDSSTIVSGSDDETLRLWKSDGTFITELRGHTKDVYCVAVFPDGSKIVSGSFDQTLRLWKSDGTFITELRGHTKNVYCVAVFPDGSKIVSGSSLTLRLWKSDGTFITELHTGIAKCVAVSPDGSTIVSGHTDKLRLWKVDGTLITELQGHTDWVTCVAISPDSSTIVSGSHDKTLRLWKSDGTFITELQGHTKSVRCVAVSPDGSTIVSGSQDETLRLWKSDGSFITELQGHNDWVTCVAISPDGTMIVSGSHDKPLRIWKSNEKNIQNARDMIVIP